MQPHRDQRATRPVQVPVRLDHPGQPVADVTTSGGRRDNLRILAQPGRNLQVALPDHLGQRRGVDQVGADEFVHRLDEVGQ